MMGADICGYLPSICMFIIDIVNISWSGVRI